MHRRLLVPGTLVLLAFAAACGDSPAGPGSDDAFTRSDANQLAPDYEEMSGVMFEGVAAPSFSVAADGGAALAVSTVTTTFTRTRTCPKGGSVTLAGTIVATRDPETKTASHQYNATRTEAACAFQARNGTATVTINGNPNVAIASNQTWSNGTPGVRTTTHKGNFSWSRSTGQTGTCTVDLTATWNPATKTRTLKGTLCNQTVDITRTATG
jgi:hypothetical protein